ncbi:MAG: carboxypeptidase regulatory-like domain-containing protein [Chloroflexi bacterium]|nr:MAG: carboxypeptidase regulatory-like domain-containing protein [Chloroflexota bacterium]
MELSPTSHPKMLEQQYQRLCRQRQTGRLDQTAFEAAVARLQFQDSQGRLWMIGVQTGQWYCDDNGTWRPGTPPEAASGREGHIYEFAPKHLTVSAVLAILIFTCLLMLPVSRAAPGPFPLLQPSPRPPLSDNGQSDNKDDNKSSGRGSDIRGTVTDLSRGRPGAGVPILLNNALATFTDTDGSYTITGLNAGAYTVSLDLNSQGELAYGPVNITLDGQNPVVVNLAYYSQPLPTDTPQPTPTLPAVSPATTSAGLPASGQALGYRPLLLIGVGSLLVVMGLIFLPLKH